MANDPIDNPVIPITPKASVGSAGGSEDPLNWGAMAVLGGDIHVGATGCQAPEDATTKMSEVDPAWTHLGRYSKDGFEQNLDRSTNQHVDQWGEVALEIVTESGLTYKTTLIETNKAVLEAYYATDVDADGTQVIVPSATGKRAPLCFTVLLANADGDRFIERYYIDKGQVSEVESRTMQNGEVSAYGVTYRAYPSDKIADPRTGKEGSAKIFRATAADAS
ncbi:MAG: hypothetical protein LBB54_04600 [Cellulomonadaceae bacterium]|jgi:hypothetical protein|nr:hypothetical protein [Cellulomonadaceae bacterium]